MAASLGRVCRTNHAFYISRLAVFCSKTKPIIELNQRNISIFLRNGNRKNAATVLSNTQKAFLQLRQLLPAAAVRCASSTPTQVSVPEIPDAPPIPDVSELVINQLNALGEPTLASLGLASSWKPSGWVQSVMEMVHVDLGLAWWQTILITAFTLRVALFPLMVLTQRSAGKMSTIMPRLTKLQQDITDARVRGDQMEAMMLTMKMMDFMKTNDVKPFRPFMFSIAQFPIFLSVFFAIRGMASLPVESLKTGGILWFQDLTLMDPFYVLPALTAATLWLTMELGIDAGVRSGNMPPVTKVLMRCFPLLALVFMIKFPSAMCVYWLGTNVISLMQAGFIRIPSVREALKIPKVQPPKAGETPKKKEGFLKSVTSSYSNSRLIKEMEDRQRMDAMNFEKAGIGPLVKTFKQDPTKAKLSSGSGGGGGDKQQSDSKSVKT